MTPEQRAKARERNKRWRKKNPDKVRELNRVHNKRWKKENAERHREHNRLYRARHRDRLREYQREWTRKNPDKVREYKRRYVEKMKRLRRHLPPMGELRQKALMQVDAYAIAFASVPRGIPAWIRDDAISDVLLMVYEDGLPAEQIAPAVKRALGRYRDLERKETEFEEWRHIQIAA